MLVVVDGVTRKETVDEFRERMAARMAENRRRRELDEAAARSQQAAAMRRTTTARKSAGAAAPVPAVPQTPAPPVAASVPAPVVQDPVPVVPVASPAPPAPRAHPTPVPVVAVAPSPVPRPAPPAAHQRSVSARDRARLAAITAVVQGDAVVDVAARHGVSATTVYNWLAAAGMPRRGPTGPLDGAAVAVAYESGTSVAELAVEHGVTEHWVRQLLKNRGVELRRQQVRTGPRSKLYPHRDVIVAAYEAGASVPMLADRYGTTPWTVRRALARWGVQRRDDRSARSGGHPKALEEYPAELVAAVVDAYTSGLTREAVAVTVPGVTSTAVVARILAKSGTPMRPSAAVRQRTDDEHAALLAQIDALLAQGLTHAQAGARLGFAQTTVSKWLRERAAATPPEDATPPPPPPGLPDAAPSAPAPLSTPPDVAPDPLAEPLEPAARAPDPPTHADVRAHATAIVSGLLDAAAALAEVAAHVHPLVDAATATLAHLTPEEP